MEKWIIKPNSLIDLEKFGWSIDLLIDGKQSIEVYGDTKEECFDRAKLICKAQEMKALLKVVYSAYGDPKIQDMVESILSDL